MYKRQVSGKFDFVREEINSLSEGMETQTKWIDELVRTTNEDKLDIYEVVKGVDERVDQVFECLDNERRNLGTIVRSAIADHVGDYGQQSLSKRQDSVGIGAGVWNPAKEDMFLLARRSLLVWPSEECSVAGLEAFARNYMKMTDQELGSVKVARVKEFTKLPKSVKKQGVCYRVRHSQG